MSSEPDPRKVFVVYGRNEAARRAMFDFLRSINLQPIEWSQALEQSGKGAPFIGEVLDAAFEAARAVVVLLTGDDVAMLRDDLLRENDPQYESELTPQGRPNVLFEAGMAFGRHPDRTVIVELGPLRPISDLAGRHSVRMKDDLSSRQDLASRLRTAGCSVDLSGTDWHTSGQFPQPTQPAPTPTVAQVSEGTSLAEEELKILRYLAQKEANFGRGATAAQELVDTLGILMPRVQHYLAELDARKLIITSRYINRSTQYSLSRPGRALLLKMGEI